MTGSIPYQQLAEHIVSGRTARTLNQAELAAILGVKQQSVSRWEAGTHRPRVDQIPGLAAALGADAGLLMELAGFGVPVSVTAPPPFPIDALAPVTFEQFTADLVEALYPEATVRQQGATGHRQDGTDVVATFPDGTSWSFQCKRVERFGPADIEKVVAAHSLEADRKFLVLSRPASPQASEALARHAGWTLWDKQDINRKVRILPVEAQERLVDIYFRGQRMALLGRSEPGPWMTVDQYFSPFHGRAAVFSHDWDLVGRDAEIERLAGAFDGTAESRVVLVTGPGGIGKTRIVKDAIVRVQAAHKRTLVRFLSAAREPDRASLEDLGRGEKILVIDDAHDRDGLGALIEYAAAPVNRTRLLIVTRPYAEQRIRNELGIFNIVDPPTIALGRLDAAALEALVSQVLKTFDGAAHLAESIVSIAADSPLVAAMAARIVARDGVPSELARGNKSLRQFILARFTDVVTGNIGSSTDSRPLRQILEVLAVIQPFHVDDRAVAALVAAVFPEITSADVTRGLKLLIDGGVLYKRGSLYRLMPDLLGDFLIEESCIGADGRLTRFATTLADEANDQQLVQLLVNLGRMDWRRADGDPSASDLLAPLWAKLRAIDTKYDGRIDAVEAVAVYQPVQALAFVQSQIEQDNLLPQFGAILRRVAISSDHRDEALRLLWDLGRDDARDLNPHPGHPIRVLAELVGYEEHKSFAFNEDISRFAFGLLDEPSAWESHYAPFDILEPLLSGQGLTTRSAGRNIVFSPFFIDHDVVAGIRMKVVDRAIGLLTAANPRTARRAALFLNNALRAPYGMMNAVAPEDLDQAYQQEFATTLEKIGTAVRSGDLAPWTLLGLISSMSWHARFDEGPLGDQVRAIHDDLPVTLDLRLYAALTDGADWEYTGQIAFADWTEDHDWQSGFVAELLAAMPDSTALWATIAGHLEALDRVGVATGNCGPLIDKLIAADLAIGRALLAIVEGDPSSRLRWFIGYALGALLEQHPDEGVAHITRLLVSSEPALRAGAASALIGLSRVPTPQDIALLGSAITAADPLVASRAVAALRTWKELGTRATIDLALSVRFDLEPQLFEPFAMVLRSRRADLLGRFSPGDVSVMLERMRAMPKIEGHWADDLLKHLAEKHSEQLAIFLFERADRALSGDEDGEFSALGYSHRRGHLGFQDSPAVRAILARAWAWLREHDLGDGPAHYRRADILAKMFKIDSDPVVEFFEALLPRATADDLRWIARIVRHAHHSFAFKYQAFVLRYFDRCKAVGRELVKHGLDMFEAAALSGGWSGTAGEPMPRDIRARDEARDIMARLSRLSPAYPLYRVVLDQAERNIDRSIREGRAMDDEE